MPVLHRYMDLGTPLRVCVAYYDPMDGGGRATLGAKAESNAGAIAEEQFSTLTVHPWL